MKNVFSEKLSKGDLNNMKGHLGKRFNFTSFTLNGKKYETQKLSGKEELRKDLIKFVGNNKKSKLAVDKFLHSGGLGGSKLYLRKRVMNDLFPDDGQNEVAPAELRQLDIPEEYNVKFEDSKVSVSKSFAQKKVVSVRSGMDGHTSALIDKANRGFALGKGSGPEQRPAGFALSSKPKF